MSLPPGRVSRYPAGRVRGGRGRTDERRRRSLGHFLREPIAARDNRRRRHSSRIFSRPDARESRGAAAALALTRRRAQRQRHRSVIGTSSERHQTQLARRLSANGRHRAVSGLGLGFWLLSGPDPTAGLVRTADACLD